MREREERDICEKKIKMEMGTEKARKNETVKKKNASLLNEMMSHRTSAYFIFFFLSVSLLPSLLWNMCPDICSAVNSVELIFTRHFFGQPSAY